MKGNEIIVTSNPRGPMKSGYVAAGQTFRPGLIVMIDGSVALKHGLHTYKLYDVAADGVRHPSGLAVVCGDTLQGQAAETQTFAAGQHVPNIYHPVRGEELNCVVADVTADGTEDHAIGELLMVDDGTGKLVVTTGTPESTPFFLLETLTNVAADMLSWVQYNGSP